MSLSRKVGTQGNNENLRVKFLIAVGITLVAFVLSWYVAQPFSFSMGTLMGNQGQKDFNMTDFYNIVADARPVRNLEKDIVIINIDRADRSDIIDLIDILNYMEPKAVGIDVTFNERREGDERLLEALHSLPNLVLAQCVKGDPEHAKMFVLDDNSWFRDSVAYNYGVVNLPSKYAGSTIREFPLWFPTKDGEKMPSFVLALAQQVDTAAVARLLERGNQKEIIDYPGHEYTVMDWHEVPDHPEEVEGKIVLVGATGEAGDVHVTPIHDREAGVLIHANALATVLNQRYYTKVPGWGNYLLAGVLCLLVAFFVVAYTSKDRGCLVRVFQVVLVYLAIRIGYMLFVDKRVIFDFSYTLLMLAFVLFAGDMWNGVSHWINKIKQKIWHTSTKDSAQ